MNSPLFHYGLLVLLAACCVLLRFFVIPKGTAPGEVFRNWQRLWTTGPSDCVILGAPVAGDVLGDVQRALDNLCYRISSVQPKQTPESVPEPISAREFKQSWFPIGRESVPGLAARVHLVPDCIARLSRPECWTGRKSLDCSRFCFLQDATHLDVDVVARGRRLCLDFRNEDGLVCKQGFPIEFQVAVHWYLPVDLRHDNDADVDDLFDSLPRFIRKIRTRVRGFLNAMFARLPYQEIFPNVSRILDELNEQWCSQHDFLQIQFTSLIVWPKMAPERIRYNGLQLQLRRPLRDRRTELEDELEELKSKLKDGWTEDGESMGGWRGIEEKLTTELDGLAERLTRTIDAEEQSLIEFLKVPRSEEDVIKIVKETFVSGTNLLETTKQQLEDVLEQIPRFFKSLNDLENEATNECRRKDERGDE